MEELIEEQSRIQMLVGNLKRYVTTAIIFGMATGILYVLWTSAGSSKAGVGAVYGFLEGIVFIVCVWLGFLIGYFAGKVKKRD